MPSLLETFQVTGSDPAGFETTVDLTLNGPTGFLWIHFGAKRDLQRWDGCTTSSLDRLGGMGRSFAV